MSLILLIESGTEVCSVGVARDGEVIAIRESHQGRDHAGRVATFTQELLSELSIKAEELDAVAVSKGPGSYTGLRIGVSFAKGLCYGLNIPLVAVGSLDSLVSVAMQEYASGRYGVIDGWESSHLAPMIDARRMEVYNAIFDSCGEPLCEVSAEVVDSESFKKWQGDAPFIIFGDGAAKCCEVLPWAKLIDVTPSVRGLAPLAQKLFEQGTREDVAYFEPLYLKDFIATTPKKKFF
ncbi:MAG: tRNA (adenosine(37)-N6)-threonylcarbamoyltransferase complex dimerization subunit type 1 TsaB [Rikenellaceae bacterium]